MGIPATGKKVSVEVMDMGRVREGKFCDHWGLADMGGLMAQLGVAPVAR
jgi:predicted ester cyclase